MSMRIVEKGGQCGCGGLSSFELLSQWIPTSCATDDRLNAIHGTYTLDGRRQNVALDEARPANDRPSGRLAIERAQSLSCQAPTAGRPERIRTQAGDSLDSAQVVCELSLGHAPCQVVHQITPIRGRPRRDCSFLLAAASGLFSAIVNRCSSYQRVHCMTGGAFQWAQETKRPRTRKKRCEAKVRHSSNGRNRSVALNCRVTPILDRQGFMP